MKRFEYKNAKTTAQAASILKKGKAAILAGGTDIPERTETLADKAGATVVENAFPLLNNKYKTQIARTLVKRAILA